MCLMAASGVRNVVIFWLKQYNIWGCGTRFLGSFAAISLMGSKTKLRPASVASPGMAAPVRGASRFTRYTCVGNARLAARGRADRRIVARSHPSPIPSAFSDRSQSALVDRESRINLGAFHGSHLIV